MILMTLARHSFESTDAVCDIHNFTVEDRGSDQAFWSGLIFVPLSERLKHFVHLLVYIDFHVYILTTKWPKK